MKCPKCGSEDVFIQNVQTGSTTTGKVVTREPRNWGCLGGLIILPFKIMWFCSFGWIIGLFGLVFGHKGAKVTVAKTKGKETAVIKTKATCQNCGHTWNV